MTTDTPPDAARTNATDLLVRFRQEEADLLAGRAEEAWPGERHYIRLTRAVIAYGNAVRAQVLPIDGETFHALRAAEGQTLDAVLELALKVCNAAGASDPDPAPSVVDAVVAHEAAKVLGGQA